LSAVIWSFHPARRVPRSRVREAVLFSGVSSAASDVSASDFDDARDGSPLGLREADGHPFAGGSWAGSSGLRM